MVEVKKENTIMTIIIIACLIIPAFIQSLVSLGKYNQLIIGTIVNTGLFLTGIYSNNNKKVIAMSVLPSVSSMATGILFGGLTYYSKLMLPFIWLGNLSLVIISKSLKDKLTFKFSGLIAIVVKVSIIYLGFLLMSNIFNFPNMIKEVMGSAMGIIQVYTSLLGLGISMLFLK